MLPRDRFDRRLFDPIVKRQRLGPGVNGQIFAQGAPASLEQFQRDLTPPERRVAEHQVLIGVLVRGSVANTAPALSIAPA